MWQKRITILLVLLVLVPSTPVHAATGWSGNDITIRALGAPAAAGLGPTFSFATNLNNEGPAARVIFLSADKHIHQLKVDPSGWRWQDITQSLFSSVPVERRHLLLAEDVAFGYMTYLSGQGPVARIVYMSDNGHIHEFTTSTGFTWSWANMTERFAMPIASAAAVPVGYETNLPGQGQLARLIYHSTDGQVQELSVGASTGWQWRLAVPSLSMRAGAPPAAGFPIGYATNIAAQGPQARVVYRSGDGHIRELRVGSETGMQWRHRDLTADTHAPMVLNGPHPYVTTLTNQGQVARVVFTSLDNQVQELSFAADLTWRHANLTAIALWPVIVPVEKPPAARLPIGYQTNLNGQGPVARVVFRQWNTNHVWELSVGADGIWRGANLTNKVGAPPAQSEPFGYTTALNTQLPTGRVVFRRSDGHLFELSVT